MMCVRQIADGIRQKPPVVIASNSDDVMAREELASTIQVSRAISHVTDAENRLDSAVPETSESVCKQRVLGVHVPKQPHAIFEHDSHNVTLFG